VEERILIKGFDRFWSDFDTGLQAALKADTSPTKPTKRSIEDLLSEVIENTRGLANRLTALELHLQSASAITGVRPRGEVPESVGLLKFIEALQLREGKPNFTIGDDTVTLPDLGEVLTARLRALQLEIESVRNEMSAKAVAVEQKKAHAENEITDALASLLKKQVFPMLESELWVARYIDTLANASSVPEELMHRFCKSQDAIEVFMQKGRWAAALKSRKQGRTLT
jgi:hypothetical protein